MFKIIFSEIGAKRYRGVSLFLAMALSVVHLIWPTSITAHLVWLILYYTSLYAPDSWFGIENEQPKRRIK